MYTLNILLQIPLNEDSSVIKLIALLIGLAVCVVAFIYFLRRTDKLINQRAEAAKPKVEAAAVSNFAHDDVSDEEAAAIALAIHLYKSRMHDMESLTITLQKVSRIYSPWSSKIYTLRQNPR